MKRRVVPSQVVSLLDKHFPTAVGDPSRKIILESPAQEVALQQILDYSASLPDECLPTDWFDFDQCQRRLAEVLAGQRTTSGTRKIPRSTDNPGDPSLLAAFRELLTKAPDEGLGPETQGLEFIGDPAFREMLRTDLSAVNRALSNGEWKAATVLAGSVVEALLLAVLLEKTGVEINDAKANLLSNGTFKSKSKELSSDPKDRSWSLFHYVQVAHHLKLIQRKAYEQASLIVDFRNLIHPAKEQRGEGKCNRATALSAVAAIEHVVNDLTERYNKAAH